jgi:hypothetical protein
MFGYRIPNKTDLVTVDNFDMDSEQISNQIVDKANEIRQKYDQLKTKKEKSNTTFKNKLSETIKFIPGDLVLHRQMQVSTGTGSKWKPLFTGPFIINLVDKNQRTAVCQNVSSGKTIKAHFNNLVRYVNQANRNIPKRTLEAGPLSEK